MEWGEEGRGGDHRRRNRANSSSSRRLEWRNVSIPIDHLLEPLRSIPLSPPPPLPSPISLSPGHARPPAQSATGSLGDEGAGGDGGTMAVMVAVGRWRWGRLGGFGGGEQERSLV